MLLSRRRGKKQKIQKWGGEVEQRPGKIKGGNSVSKCENYCLLFCVLEVCMYGYVWLVNETIKIGVSANLGHLFWWAPSWLKLLKAKVAQLLNQNFCLKRVFTAIYIYIYVVGVKFGPF